MNSQMTYPTVLKPRVNEIEWLLSQRVNTGLNLVLLFITLLFAGCGNEGSVASAGKDKEKTLYTCGMHPQVIQDKPGNCPICGMKLTPVRNQTASSASTNQIGGSSTITVDPTTTQTMGIRTAMLKRGPLRRTIRTVGAIDYNEIAMADVTTKFKGWVEKLYVNTTGQLVMRGDPLFEIYSPDLYSAQREYLLAMQQGTNSTSSAALRTSAQTKLKFFDVSDEQIAELEKTGQPRKTLSIFAPQDGFVMEKMVVQGQMVDAGMKLYRLADIGLVWVQAQVYEQDLAYLKLGQEAMMSLDYLSDREFRGRVTYIYPNVDEKTRTAKVRMEFHNPGYFLKPGMFATVQVTSELESSVLLVPDMAILRSGEKNTVFVALDGGKFEPRTVMLGPQSEGDNYQVMSGLKEDERIVTSGQFMLDSESQLREAIQKMQQPANQTVPALNPGAAGRPVLTNATNPSHLDASVKYICPMPEHVSIEYDHSGKCPICGMTLVPVTTATLKRLHPGGKLLYYTCPMPEHNDLHADKPGNCPKCGMTLIPMMAAPALPTNDSRGPTQSTILYTCPMSSHADVVSDQPGKCPKCEMELVPTSTVRHGKIAEENWKKKHASETPTSPTTPHEHQS